MSIKSILCIIDGSERDAGAAKAALALGRAHAAQVRFLHISLDPCVYAAMYGYGDGYVLPALLDACEKNNAEKLTQAKAKVVSLTSKYHVPLDTTELPTHHASAKFVHLMGSPNSIIAREGRLSDLIITGRSITNSAYDDTILAALFDTGRPVMLLPEQDVRILGEYKTIALSWKGTLEAGRAMYYAMPFLEKAEKVYVLTAEGPGESYDLAAQGALLEYLRAHGVHAQCVVTATGQRSAAEVLLGRAKELNVDMLVMGAYGHSRLREMLLGGVTHHMLEKSNIPLFLSH